MSESVSEDPVGANSRRLGSIALGLYAVGMLIVIIGFIIAIGTILSSILSSILRISEFLGIPVTAETARIIAGFISISIGFAIHIAFIFYGSFKGRSVVSNVKLSGWEKLIKNLSILHFIAMLLIAVGFFIIPGTSFIYKNIILALISALLLMISAILIPIHKQSITAGVLLIIAATLSISAQSFQFPGLQQMAGFSSFFSAILLSGVLSDIALIIIGISSIVRGIIRMPLIYKSIACVGGIIFVASLIYDSFSSISSILSFPDLSSFLSYVPHEIVLAYQIFYGTSITGLSLVGVAGILGIIALIFAVVFIVKSEFPSISITPPPPPPPPPPT